MEVMTTEYKEESYKDVRKKLIHPWEKPTRVINILICIIGILVGTILLSEAIDKIATLDAFMETNTFDVFLEEANIFIAGIGLLAATIYTLGINYARTKADAILISKKQFPEVYKIIVEYSEKLEMGYVPEAFIEQKGGVINAFATSFFAKRYISINSDIFEVSYLEHKDMDTLSFIIAHELTHLKRKHATTFMAIIELPGKLIPIWSSTVSRAREYTCDRHAAWLCPEGIDGLMLLSAGKHLYKNIDVEDYVETSNKRYRGLFCWLVNLNAGHPVMPKRMKALKNLDKPGKLF